jgi:hypothetical protein
MKKFFICLGLSALVAALFLPATGSAQVSRADTQNCDLTALTGSGGRGMLKLTTSNDISMVWREMAPPNLKVATAYSPYTGIWSPLNQGYPTQLEFGYTVQHVGILGDANTAWFFSPSIASWNSHSLPDITGYDASGYAAVAWSDGNEAVGYSSSLDMKSLQPLTGIDFNTSIYDKNSTTSVVIYNDTDAYGYGALTNTWTHQTLASPSTSIVAGAGAHILWNASVKYGYSSILSSWVSEPVANPPLTGVGGGKIAMTYNTIKASVFNGEMGAWHDSPAYNQTAPPSVKIGNDVVLVWAKAGAFAYDMEVGSWFNTGIVPGMQHYYRGDAHDNSLALWNNSEAWGYHRLTGQQGATVNLDGTPVTVLVKRDGIILHNTNDAYGMGQSALWVNLALNPAKTYHSDMFGYVGAIWADDEAYAFDTRTSTWNTIPLKGTGTVGGAVSTNHAIFWNDDYAVAYDGINGNQYPIALTANPIAGRGAQWTTAIYDTGRTIYAFSSKTHGWASQTLPINPHTLMMGGREVVAITANNAYAFGAEPGTWAVQAMDKPNTQLNIGVSLATVATATSIYTHSGFTGLWTKIP